jgi:predicted DNA-binding transcriptional regulator AlpA
VLDAANDEASAVTPNREDWDDGLAKHKLLDSEQVAALLGVSPTRLCTWRGEGKGPPFIKLETKLVRYRLASVLRWLTQQEIGPVERYPKQGRCNRA